jgi:hypothetical protein
MPGRVLHKYHGYSMDECIKLVPGELIIDAVGLWQIMAHGRDGFELSGDDLIDFVRRCLLALFAKGAKPVVGATDGAFIWKVVNYGKTADEMAQAIIDEWVASGREPDVGGPWFALPHIYQETRMSGLPSQRRQGAS